MTKTGKASRWRCLSTELKREVGIFLIVAGLFVVAFAVIFLISRDDCFSVWIPALLTLVLAFFARLGERSWLAPGALFALVWAFAILLPLIAAPDYYVHPGGVWWIVLAIFAIYIGSMLGTRGVLFRPVYRAAKNVAISPGNNQTREFFLRKLHFLTLIFSISGFGAAFILLWSSGRGISAFQSVESLVEMGHEFSVARYQHGYAPPFIARIFIGCVYIAAPFGGLLFALSRSLRSRLIALLPFAPAITLAIIMTTRGSVLFPSVLWLASYLSMLVLLNRGHVRLFTWARVIAVLAGVLLIAIMAGALQMSRRAASDLGVLPSVLSHVRGMFFGHLSCFSRWFEQSWQEIEMPHLGAYTFSGVFDFLGIHVRVQGIYSEALVLVPGESSNIYTAFRGLIQDFTLVGSIAVLFVMGVFAGGAFRRVSQGNIRYLPILVVFYLFAIWSPLGSVFNYNSIVAAFCIFTAYWLIATKGCSIVLHHKSHLQDQAMGPGDLGRVR